MHSQICLQMLQLFQIGIIVKCFHGWFSTLHVFHLIQKFNMASTTNYFWCWSFKIFSETTRGMNLLFCRNMSYLTLLKSLVFFHWKSKMSTAAGQIKKSNSSQKKTKLFKRVKYDIFLQNNRFIPRVVSEKILKLQHQK
jgi:hypothetical protein